MPSAILCCSQSRQLSSAAWARGLRGRGNTEPHHEKKRPAGILGEEHTQDLPRPQETDKHHGKFIPTCCF